jgi:hypothetical protein
MNLTTPLQLIKHASSTFLSKEPAYTTTSEMVVPLIVGIFFDPPNGYTPITIDNSNPYYLGEILAIEALLNDYSSKTRGF